MRQWTEFDEPAPRVDAAAARASINPTGEITFDVETFKEMGEPRAMLLLYEKATRTVGLKAADPSQNNAVLVRARHERSNRVVRSTPFLKRNGIEVTRSMRFPHAHLEDGVLILDLRTIVTAERGGWNKGNGKPR